MGTINMRLFILALTLLLVQLSQQAALAEADNVSELAFPDGEQPAARDEDDLAEEASDVEYGFPYYLCKCSFEEYEEYWGEPSVDMDYYDYAWCPCFEYDTYSNGLEYAYEQYEWTDEAAARSWTETERRNVILAAAWTG